MDSSTVEISAATPTTSAAGPTPAADGPAPGTPFDAGKAIRYSVANVGPQAVFALFNFGMPLYLDTYHLDPTLIGLLANERSFVGSLVQPLVGRLSDRIRTPLGRRRPFFLVGVPLMALSLMTLAIHPPLWVVLALMTIGAFFLFIATDPYMALLADLWPQNQRSRVGGFIGVTTALGQITFNVLAAVLWKDHEPLVFALTITVLLVAFGFTFVTVKEPPLPPAEPRAPAGARPDPRAYLRGILAYPEAAKYMLAALFFWMGSGAAVPFLTLFGAHVLHANGQQVFLLPLAAVVAQVLFSIPAGYLGDRIGKKRMMLAGLTLFGITVLIGSQSADLVQGTLTLAVVGIAQASLIVLNPLLTDLIPRKRTAEFIGLVSAIWSFGQPLGSVVAGALVDLMRPTSGPDNAYRWVFVFAGAMALVAAALLTRVHPERAVLA